MEIYVVAVFGGLYDEVYSEVVYAGLCEDEAQKTIENNKGRTLLNGGVMYAYKEVWVNGVRIKSIETGL